MVYSFKSGCRLSGNAQAVGEELERIEATSGALTPSAVVEESRPEEATLHPFFEWDDEAAAELYRQDQARHVIRSVQVVTENPNRIGETIGVTAYVHVRPDESPPCYVTTARAMSDEDMKAQVLADALSQLRGFEARYRHLSELGGIFLAIERAAQREQARKVARANRKKRRAEATV